MLAMILEVRDVVPRFFGKRAAVLLRRSKSRPAKLFSAN